MTTKLTTKLFLTALEAFVTLQLGDNVRGTVAWEVPDVATGVAITGALSDDSFHFRLDRSEI
jgi:hypothetical protein